MWLACRKRPSAGSSTLMTHAPEGQMLIEVDRVHRGVVGVVVGVTRDDPHDPVRDLELKPSVVQDGAFGRHGEGPMGPDHPGIGDVVGDGDKGVG